MKTEYVNRTKIHPHYKPGIGWLGNTRNRYSLRFRSVPTSSSTVRLSPLSVSGHRRPGMVTKLVILAFVAVVAASMWVVFGGLNI